MTSMMHRLLLLVLTIGLTACASDNLRDVREGRAKMVTTMEDLPPPDSSSIDGVYQGQPDYRVGPQDQLEIAVYQLPELSRTVRVNTRGYISLPLLGPILVGGKTVTEIEAELVDKLSQDFLQDPQVMVFVAEYASQRITVEGAVKRPGIMPLSSRTSLLQAIVMAGGVSETANPRGVIIFRTIKGQRMAAVFDLREIRGGNAPDPQVYGDDLIVVDESGSKSAYRALLASMPVLGLFRPLL
jgi:polysaccharide export outer membrane protein